MVAMRSGVPIKINGECLVELDTIGSSNECACSLAVALYSNYCR